MNAQGVPPLRWAEAFFHDYAFNLPWHGGGWVIADLDTYDATPRALAAETGAAVLSVHDRQAPEHRFPAAHEDAVAAWRWATENAREPQAWFRSTPPRAMQATMPVTTTVSAARPSACGRP